ncbi:hypothetical protein YC2023_045540 [Brassica napus]
MNSEQNNSTSFPPTEPELCDNRCGFFVCFSCNKKAGVMGFKCKCVNYNQYILILLWCCLYKREEIPH